MATSSKVQFDLATLREQATESINARIATQETFLTQFDNNEALAARVKDWRDRQEVRLRELISELGETSDNVLARFRIEPMPEADKFERQKALRVLNDLRARKSQIEAKAASLVPDEDGNITLTKTQLVDFFDL